MPANKCFWCCMSLLGVLPSSLSKTQTNSIVWLQGVADCVLPAKSRCPEGTLIADGFCYAKATKFCGELQSRCRWICLYLRYFGEQLYLE